MRGRFIAALVAVSSGCLFPSLDGLTAGGASDAGDASDAGQDAADDAGTNLVPNATFDSNCDGWTVYQSTLTSDTDAHTGSGSCRVCRQTDTLYSIDEDDGVLPVPKVGQSWHARAWVKLPAGGRPHPVAVYMRTWDAADTNQLDIVYGGEVPLTTSWQPLDVDFTDTMPNAAILDVFVSASHAQAGDCFLVDDVSVVRTN